MKICKKIVLITMAFLMLTTLKVYADDYADTATLVDAKVTLVPSSTTVKAGEIVTITISAKCEKGIDGIDATLEYDKTKLELTGLETQNYYTSFSDTDDETGKFKFSVLYGDVGAPAESPNEARIAIISFKVLDKVNNKEDIIIKLSEIEVVDPSFETTIAEDEQTILTVVGEQNPEDETPEGDNPEEEKPEGENPEEEKTEGETPKGEEPDDPTTADKPMNNAGAETYGLIVLLIVIVSFILYRKYQKYKSVK